MFSCKSKSLVATVIAEKEKRRETYWDKNAKNVYTILLGIGILFFVLGGIFIFFGICDEEEYPPLGDLIQKNITDGSDPKGGLLWIECPTYWMAMGFAADIFLILGFWFRKKLVCCHCC